MALETPEIAESIESAAEIPSAAHCLKTAREMRAAGDLNAARRWALRVVDAGDDFASWQAAAALIAKLGPVGGVRRTAKLALLGSYTTVQLKPLLRLAGLRAGIDLEIYESNYGQYRQEILDQASAMYAFAPDLVLLAVHDGEVRLPEFSESPEAAVQAELARWTSLWKALGERSTATVVQHGFVLPDELPLGHMAAKRRGTRYRMMRQLNEALADAAPESVAIVDCDRIASSVGKRTWRDPRYWHFSKQAVSLAALPALARHTAAVIGGALGLSRKCVVFDLDNTLWGGVVGEDQVSGIRVGEGTDGEAYADFQEYIRELKNRGLVLAVCSKNNEADAREAFLRHPGMRLRLEDFAVFAANWESKPDNLRMIARTLNLGLDALVFVDDNPAERHFIRQELPEVEVVTLPPDPALYRRALAGCLLFEVNSFTEEDARRSEQYRGRAKAAAAAESAASLEEFCRSLEMKAVIRPFRAEDLERITQLVNKTNQFNLTTRRYTAGELQRVMDDPAAIHFSIRLKDRYTDHGLVGVLIASVAGSAVRIETWLMSCRVIGRTVESAMLRHLCRQAGRRGCNILQGTYIRSQKNGLVKDLYGKLGFSLVEDNEHTTVWRYDAAAQGEIPNQFIETAEEGVIKHGT